MINKSLMLNLSRINDIISRKDGNKNFDSKTLKIKFHLKDLGAYGLEKNEEIIGINGGGYVLEGTYHNEFIAIQRMLSFGSCCTVLEPENIKNKIIETLKKMREIYND